MSSSKSPHESQYQENSEVEPPQPRPGIRPEPKHSSGLLYAMVALWLIAAGAIYFVQRPQFFDHQIGNIITLIAGFLMFLSLFSWLCTVRAIPLALKVGVPLVLIASLGIFFVFFRIVEVSGDLVPRFTYRFAPPVDAQLEDPEQAELSVDLSPTSPQDFPQFLGPDRDLSYQAVTLADQWNDQQPEQLWKQPIGAGWGSFAAVNGFAVTLEQRGEEEIISCYEIETGKLAWSHSHSWRHETLMGGVGPRSTPTIHEGRVYAQGAGGMLFCLQGDTGEVIWQRNLLEEFNVSAAADSKNIAWGRAASPLVVEEKVILPAGGPTDSPVSLVAYHKETGEEIWRGGDSQISYASAALGTLGGKRQVLIVNESSVAGHDLQTGTELWNHPWPGSSNTNASVSQAVPLPGDRVLVSKGYGGGSAMLQIESSDGNWSAKELWQSARLLKTKFSNVAVLNNHGFALSDGILEAVDLKEGERLWKKGRYGHGQILLVGEKLLVMAESGELHLLEINARRPTELSEVSALSGKSWNTLCLYGPYLLVRNGTEAACFQLPLAEEGMPERE